jgi:hypothetical protein
MAWVRARLCKLQKRVHSARLAAASDKVDQLLAHGRWFSPGTPVSSTTIVPSWYSWNIAESGIKHQKSINQSIISFLLANLYVTLRMEMKLFQTPYEKMKKNKFQHNWTCKTTLFLLKMKFISFLIPVNCKALCNFNNENENISYSLWKGKKTKKQLNLT